MKKLNKNTKRSFMGSSNTAIIVLLCFIIFLGNHRQKDVNETFSKNTRSENPSAQATQDEEFDCIPSETQKTIFNMANKNIGGGHSSQKTNNSAKDRYGTATFRTAREFQDFTKRAFKPDDESRQSKTQNPNEKNLPPIKRFLGEGKYCIFL